MSDPVWYYAQGDTEKGPLTTPQIKALTAAGKIRPDDFVWKEGTDNWAPAREMAELFSKENAVAERAEGPTKGEVAAAAQNPIGGAKTHTLRHAAPIFSGSLGQISLAVGLFMIVLARGCDSLGYRYVLRLQAMAQTSRQEFETEWKQKRQAVEVEHESLAKLISRTPSQQQRLNQLVQRLTQLADEERSQRERQEEEVWFAQDRAALIAEQESQVWGFWREAAFLAGTLILVGALLTVAFVNSGSERWVYLALIGAILFGIYSQAYR